MSDEITTAFERQFSDNFKLVAQQLETDISSKVTVETDIKDKKYIDYVGTIDPPDAQTSLIQETNLDEVQHSRRLVITLPYPKAIPVPRAAVIRSIADPTNAYTQALKAMWARFLESKLFTAAIGTSIAVSTEELTQSSIPLPATQKYEEAGTVGMIASKIVRALTRFSLNRRDKSEKFLALSPLAIEDLFLDPDVTYPQQQALDMIRSGKMQALWGFNVMMSTELPKTGNIRSNIAWCKEGLGLGLNGELETRITERSDKNYIKQIWNIWDLGATRLQETDVYELQAYESY